MATDLDLNNTVAGYELAAPITDAKERIRNRFITQFLSQTDNGRGAVFMSLLREGRLRTNSDVASIFAAASAEIITNMNEVAEDIHPLRTILNDITFISTTHLLLGFTIITNLGTVTGGLEAGA